MSRVPAFPNRRGAKRRLIFSWLLIAILAACSSANPAPKTPNSSGPTVLVPFTPSSQNLELPTLLPTVIVPPTSLPQTPGVTLVIATPTATPSPIPVTLAPTRPRPKSTPTPGEPVTPLPEGVPTVFVTALRAEPATAKADIGPTFLATFQNKSGQDQGYKWCVEIWDPDKTKNSYGITTCKNAPFPVGTFQLATTGWVDKGRGECKVFRGRAIAVDETDQRFPFVQPDGSILWTEFTVCP